MNAVEFLKDEHEEFRALMTEFKKSQEDDPQRATQALRQLCEGLSIHSILEEQYFYPRAQQDGKADDELIKQVNEGFEEHAIVDQLIEDMQNMSDDDPELLVKGKVMIESVEHHMEEEEKEMMPNVEKELTREELEDLGQQMAKIRSNAKVLN